SATARFICCTSYSFPVEARSAQKSHLPLGAIVCTLARPEKGKRDVPVCEVGDCVKACAHCGAFMSPAMSWQACGQRFYLPFCSKLTEIQMGRRQKITGKVVFIDISRDGMRNSGNSVIAESPKKLSDQSLELPVVEGLLAAASPGKLLIFHSSPVSEGTNQKISSGFFSSKEHAFFPTILAIKLSIFQGPDSSISLAKKFVTQGCSVHIFVFSHQEVGGAWPGHIPFLTVGGVICYNSLQIKLPVLENSLFISTRALLCSLQSSAAVTLQLKLVREGDSCEESLQRLLVEDKSPYGGASYADFLFHLHVNALRLTV
ncbi:hypothetical protein cypCar_00013614, partial [Cyprinus carpio]